MAYHDLPSFLRALERAKELKRVTAEVDPELEITEIATRVVKNEGPALLFEKVKRSPYPLAINIFGSARRIELALGKAPAELSGAIDEIIVFDHPFFSRAKNKNIFQKISRQNVRRIIA